MDTGREDTRETRTREDTENTRDRGDTKGHKGHPITQCNIV